MKLPAHVVAVENEMASAFRIALADENVNLAFYERQSDPLEVLLHSHAHQINNNFQFWCVKKPIDQIEKSLEQSINGIGNLPVDILEQFHDDVLKLAQLFVEVTGENMPFVSLRTVTQDYFSLNQTSVSNRYHRDSSVISLFKTFLGSGTQWTTNENVIRAPWMKVSIQDIFEPDEKYLVDPSLFFETTCKTIGFLKGETCPKNIDIRSLEFIENFISRDEIVEFNVGNSLIHRGPGINGNEKRVLLTVSSFRLPIFNLK